MMKSIAVILGTLVLSIMASLHAQEPPYLIAFEATLDRYSLPVGASLVSDVPVGATMRGEFVVPKTNREGNSYGTGVFWHFADCVLALHGKLNVVFSGGSFITSGGGFVFSNSVNHCGGGPCDADGRVVKIQRDGKSGSSSLVSYVPSKYTFIQPADPPDKKTSFDEAISNMVSGGQRGQSRLMLTYSDFAGNEDLKALFTVSHLRFERP